MERCPFCGGQLISCDCVYEKLGIDVSPGTWAYENGLTKEQAKKWEELLREKGLVPYIEWPIVCARCGTLWPELFMAPDEEWEKYVQINERNKILCRKCYGQVKRLIDNAAKGYKGTCIYCAEGCKEIEDGYGICEECKKEVYGE